jgi:tRNA (guanine-N7-)-methyltransferase
VTSSTSSDAPSTEPGDAVTPEEGRPRRQVWGRRQGPKLRPGRRSLLDERLPEVGFTIPESGRLDPRALFGGEDRPVWLEIGFGAGEHLAWQAEANPDVGLIGVEPFINGVARLLGLLEESGRRNVRVLTDDARLLLTALPDASLERAFVLFPDPWPKLRHQKRRIVNRVTTAELARLLKPGAELRAATDDPDYARWMLEVLLAEPRLKWTAERASDWRERPADWPATRYEEKALAAGRRPTFLRFRRVEG